MNSPIVMDKMDALIAENVRLRGALLGLVHAVGAMRVPQTIADAAVQINFTLGPPYERAKAALS